MKNNKEIKIKYPNHNFITRFFLKLLKIQVNELKASFSKSMYDELKKNHGINLKKETYIILKREYRENLKRKKQLKDELEEIL